MVNIEIVCRDKDDIRQICDWCEERTYPLFHIPGYIGIAAGLELCIGCLQTLRTKIDALSILVQTGIDTK